MCCIFLILVKHLQIDINQFQTQLEEDPAGAFSHPIVPAREKESSLSVLSAVSLPSRHEESEDRLQINNDSAEQWLNDCHFSSAECLPLDTLELCTDCVSVEEADSGWFSIQ